MGLLIDTSARLIYLGDDWALEVRAVVPLTCDEVVVGHAWRGGASTSQRDATVSGDAVTRVDDGVQYIGILNDSRLAKRHFCLRRREHGWTVADLGSHCGFCLGSDLAGDGAEHPLQSGTLIHYGFAFRFEDDGGEARL